MSILSSLLMTDNESGVLKKYFVGKQTYSSEAIAAAGALSISVPESVVSNGTAGSIAVTLAAPSNQDGAIKIVKAGATMLHTATLAMTNIKGPGFCTLSGTTTLTFTAAGDTAIFMASGAKWMLIGGNAVAS